MSPSPSLPVVPPDFEATVRRALAASRAGAGPRPRSALAPELSYGRHLAPALPGARPAAVIALFYPHDGQWHLPLMVRPPHVKDHPGQVSLPGGGIEAGEVAAACALRELEEELAVIPETVRLLGELPPVFVYSSNFHVRPFVGITDSRPAFRPDPNEVAQILELPLSHLWDPAHRGTHRVVRRAVAYDAPHIAFAGHRIWGATAVILSALLAVVIETGTPGSGVPKGRAGDGPDAGDSGKPRVA